MDIELLNGKPRCTLIESFMGKVFLIKPPDFKREFATLEKAKEWVQKKNWDINISFVKGSKTLRDIRGG